MQKNCWLDSPAPNDPEHVPLSERTCVVEDGRYISFDGERMFEMGAFQHNKEAELSFAYTRATERRWSKTGGRSAWAVSQAVRFRLCVRDPLGCSCWADQLL
jgi:hypothetical protein